MIRFLSKGPNAWLYSDDNVRGKGDYSPSEGIHLHNIDDAKFLIAALQEWVNKQEKPSRKNLPWGKVTQ